MIRYVGVLRARLTPVLPAKFRVSFLESPISGVSWMQSNNRVVRSGHSPPARQFVLLALETVLGR